MPSQLAERRPLRGDEEDLFRLHSDDLVRAVRGRVSAGTDVIDEACGFGWMQLLRVQPDRDAVFPWLRVVATREAVRLSRLRREQEPKSARRAGEHLGDIEAVAGHGDVHASFESSEACEEIRRLPERCRRIFLLHLAGFSYHEITDRTGEGQRAIDKQIRRARRLLRQRLAA